MYNLVEPYKPRHPIFTLPRGQRLRELVEKLGEAEFNRRMEIRNDRIRAAERDPLRNGVRLKQWAMVEERLKTDKIVICLGGNQSSKSELGAYLTARTLCYGAWWKSGDKPVKVACLHTLSDSSIRQQQPYIYKYLPPEWRNLGKVGRITNICYTQKNGFSQNSFITPDGDECSFFNYQQDIDAIQGYTLDFIWADELLNGEWLKELPFRTMARNGRILITVTLIHGMIGAIKQVLDYCTIKQTVPVNPELFTDVSETSKLARGCPPMHVPILAVDERTKKSVIWLHTENNPFNPKTNLMDSVANKPREYVLIRAYGYCESTAISAFPKFDKRVHCLTPEQFRKNSEILAGKYTVYMSADPGGAKPWVFKYYVCTPCGFKFLIYESPDFEEFGAWAEPPDKDSPHPKWKRGAAHAAYSGASIIALKKLFKKIETETLPKILGRKTPPDIFERYIDPRMGAMTVPSAENETSFIDLMEDEQIINGKTEGEPVHFIAAYSGASGHSSNPVEASVFIINNALDYNPKEPLSMSNTPHFFILTTCQNSITTYENYSLANSKDCPLKDFLDPDRYFHNMDAQYVDICSDEYLNALQTGSY